MDASVFVEMEEACMHADSRRSSAYSFSALDVSVSEESLCLQNPEVGFRGLEAYDALDAFGSGTEADLRWMMSSSEEEDALMMDRPLLDFLNEMLMDGTVEECVTVPQDRVAYESIVSGFYDIIGEHPSAHIESSCSSDGFDSNGAALDPSVLGLVSSNSNGLVNNNDMHMSSASLTSESGREDFCIYDGNGQEEPSMLVRRSYGTAHLSDMLYASASKSYSGGINAGGYGSMDGVLSDELVRDKQHHSSSSPVTPIHPASDELSDRHVSFVKNSELNVEIDYQQLYLNDGPQGGEQNAVRVKNKRYSSKEVNKVRNRRTGAKGRKGQAEDMSLIKDINMSNRKLEAGEALDLTELLVSCAQAVGVGNSMRAFETLQQLRQNGASPNGSGLHRVIHYFCEALEARMHGIGSRAYADVACNQRPSVAKLLKVTKTALNFIPLFKLAHYFANQSILKAAEGATCLHIIDYGSFYGLQWPCLINALADRKEGPPTLTITAIEFPEPGGNPTAGLEDIGHTLSEYAKTYNVPFKFHAIAASNWEDLDPVSHTTHTHNSEQQVLVVNCMHRLRHVLDECVAASDKYASCQRQRLLEKICKLNPNLFVTAVLNATHNSPFFVSRFKEALNYYCSKFDMVDTTWGSCSDRMILERDCFYRDILNVIACEGVERIQRPEMYKHWQARIHRAGFEQMPIMPSVFARARGHLKNYYHKDFNIDHDSNRWMLISWKGRTMEAISAWKPSGACN